LLSEQVARQNQCRTTAANGRRVLLPDSSGKALMKLFNVKDSSGWHSLSHGVS
jgi:hypothetical protein